MFVELDYHPRYRSRGAASMSLLRSEEVLHVAPPERKAVLLEFRPNERV